MIEEHCQQIHQKDKEDRGEQQPLQNKEINGEQSSGKKEKRVPDVQQKESLRKLSYWQMVLMIGCVILILYLLFNEYPKFKSLQNHSDIDSIHQGGSLSSVDLEKSLQISRRASYNLPRILWIMNERKSKEAKMISMILKNQHKYFAEKTKDYQVRYYDSVDAHDWLSSETSSLITSAMLNSKYDIAVDELLRLALLFEHGGIWIKTQQVILLQNFSWVDEIFESSVKSSFFNETNCEIDIPSIFMFHSMIDGAINYLDFFIAARKNSPILIKSLLSMIEAITTGQSPHPVVKQIQLQYVQTQAKFFPSLFRHIFNAEIKLIDKSSNLSQCQQHGVQSMLLSTGPAKFTSCKKYFNDIILKDREKNIEQCGLKWMIAASDLQFTLQSLVLNIFNKGKSYFLNKTSIFIDYIINIDDNRWILQSEQKNRDVQFCIVSLKPQDKSTYLSEIKISHKLLTHQSFKKWNSIYFVKDFNSKDHIFANNKQITILNASQFEGLNLETAITSICQPKSLVFLLNYDQSLISNTGLEEIANAMKDSYVFGAFLQLSVNWEHIAPISIDINKRVQYHPDEQWLKTLKNHFRVFNSDFYRLVPQSDLHNIEGEYFDRLIPLLGMLQISLPVGMCQIDPEISFLFKRMQRVMDVPLKKVQLNVTIIANQYEKVDLARPQLNNKNSYQSLCEVFMFVHSHRWTLEKILLMNTGIRYESPRERQNKRKPQLIPKKIHHIWLGKDLPDYKKKLIDTVKSLHPNHQHILWTQDKLTQENFPYTYAIVKTILNFDLRSPYNKRAMVADLLRLQILYHHGGYYLDTNFLWLKKGSFDDWETYEFINGPQIYPRQRSARSIGFLGSMPKHPRLKELISPAYLSSIAIYSQLAHIETGPSFFPSVFRIEDEMNPNILQPSYQILYPYYPLDGVGGVNRCKTAELQSEGLLFIQKGYGYYLNCTNIYPEAHGIDMFELGQTWVFKRK